MNDSKIAASASVERTLLGVMLMENAAFYVAQQDLTSADFYLSSHRSIHRAIGRLLDNGTPADTQTLINELDRTGELEGIGGYAYVFYLTENLPPGMNAAAYARTIREKADLRRVQAVCAGAMELTDGSGCTAEDLLDDLECQLLNIRSGRGSSSQDLTAELDAVFERMETERSRTEDLLGLPSGIGALDLVTRGFQPGELTIIGAKSGVGKTSLMVQTTIASCLRGVAVLLFSLEMTKEELLRRILCAVSGVPFPRVTDARWASEADLESLVNARRRIEGWELYIDDSAGMTIEKLTAIARLHVRTKKVELIGVDYVQIVNAQGRDERLRVSAISRGLTKLAKSEQVPVIALSQLSRPDRSSSERLPKASDLRESSQLENDASVIILAHRPWSDEEGRLLSEGELVIAKNRHGDTTSIETRYSRSSLLFEQVQTRAPAEARAS